VHLQRFIGSSHTLISALGSHGFQKQSPLCQKIRKPTVEGLADEAKVNGSIDAKIGQTDNGYGASVGASTKIYRVKPYFNIGIGFSWIPKAITPLPEDPLPLPTK